MGLWILEGSPAQSKDPTFLDSVTALRVSAIQRRVENPAN